MNNETAIKILSTRNYKCGECPFSGPDCKGCRLADALDLAIEALGTDDEPKTSRQERALEIIDALKDDRLIGNKQRGTLRRAILDNTPEVPSNMTLIPTAVLDDLTKTTRELGEWVEGVEPFGYDETAVAVCSVCRHSFILDEYTLDDVRFMFKYCPNCGALMTASGNIETK